MQEQNSTHQFDKNRAAKYDCKIRMIIPGYESLYQMTNHLLRSLLPVKDHILIVGAGTGMDIITCGTMNPQWTFTCYRIALP